MGSCCRITFLIIATCFSLAAVVMIFYGGVSTFNVSRNGAIEDNILEVLNPYISCSDLYKNLTDSGIPDQVRGINVYQCYAQQAGPVFIVCFAGVLMFFTLVTGLMTLCVDNNKFVSYAFPINTGATIAVVAAAIVVIILTTNSVASHFIPCKSLDTISLEILLAEGNICLNGNGGDNTTGIKWVTDIVVFYAGAGVALISVIIFLIIHGCCSPKDRPNSAQEPLMQPMYYNTQPTSYTPGY